MNCRYSVARQKQILIEKKIEVGSIVALAQTGAKAEVLKVYPDILGSTIKIDVVSGGRVLQYLDVDDIK